MCIGGHIPRPFSHTIGKIGPNQPNFHRIILNPRDTSHALGQDVEKHPYFHTILKNHSYTTYKSEFER